jgi:hypothetical protein
MMRLEHNRLAVSGDDRAVALAANGHGKQNSAVRDAIGGRGAPKT